VVWHMARPFAQVDALESPAQNNGESIALSRLQTANTVRHRLLPMRAKGVRGQSLPTRWREHRDRGRQFGPTSGQSSTQA